MCAPLCGYETLERLGWMKEYGGCGGDRVKIPRELRNTVRLKHNDAHIN